MKITINGKDYQINSESEIKALWERFYVPR